MSAHDVRPRVFISYARSDGEAQARELSRRLEAEQVPLWRDREGMEGGRDWWQQITAAIDRVEFLVLVMTEAAVRSAMVRREWRYARQRGVTVYPVLAAPDTDFDALPRWMRSVHFYDLKHEWRKFVNDLHTRPTPLRVPFMVEDLPSDFVPRPHEYEQLASQLLDRTRGEPIAITAALRGAGGFGKTALARALCHDEAIQEAFDDGVLWVTLGERPGDLTARVEDLFFMLSGQRPGFASLETAVAALSELLADREILIVIDDVWDAAHVRPFLQGGERCARIITTRLSDVLPPGTRRIDVDAMSAGEAVALLGYGLPRPDDVDLTGLARRLGEWPLLLTLTNGALRERVLHQGQALRSAVAYVNKLLDKRGLTLFDARDAVARNAAVATTLGVSLAQLDSTERERLDELAVFPEDAEIPLATLTAFWQRTAQLDDIDTELLCDRLVRLSLLLTFDPTARFIRVHDVVRRFLVERLGERAAALHGVLLDSARPVDGDWCALAAEDPYWWRWLFEHLQAAGLGDEMRRTALDLRYLAAKCIVRTPWSAETDLRRAEAAFPDDVCLAALGRRFGQSAHLFGDCADVRQACMTLCGRLHDVPVLRALAQSTLDALSAPRLQALATLPDMPHPALVRTLGSRRGAMRACAVSVDGRLIATAASDRHIMLWDAVTGLALRTLDAVDPRGFSGHWVRALAFSKDATLLVAAAGDRRLWLWHVPTGEMRGQCVGHTDVVTGCAISHDGGTLVSSSLDGTLKIWDLPACTLRRTLGREWGNDERGWVVPQSGEGHWSAVMGCALSHDGRTVASASADQTLILWDLDSGRELRVLVGHSAAVNDCAFCPDGSHLVSASSDRSLRVWDCRDGAHRAVLAHRQAVTACDWSSDGATVVSASADGTVRLWSRDVDELLQTLSGHDDWVNDCALSSNAGLVVSAANDGTAKVWSLRIEPEPHRGRRHEGWVLGCAPVPMHDLLFTAAQDHTLMLWDALRGRSRRIWRGHDAPVRGCAASADGRLLASACADGSVAVWSVATAERVLSLAGHRDWVNACAFHPEGHLLASVSNDRSLRLWDLRTRSRKLAVVAHTQWINACVFSPDGQHVVTAAADGSLRRWSLDIDEALWEAWLVAGRRPLTSDAAEAQLRPLTLAGHAASANHCAFAPDGSYLVSASSDRTLKVWDPDSGTLRRTLSGHLEGVAGCAVSADGERILSVSTEGGVRVWRAADGVCLISMQVDGGLYACSWTGEGDTLAAVGARGVYFFACG